MANTLKALNIAFVFAFLSTVIWVKGVPADVEPKWTMAGGYMHTCATNGDSLYCWGSNTYGQLGTGKTNPESRPVKIPLPANRTVKFLSAGFYNTCVVYNNDSVSCWGNNDNGQLGLGRQETIFGNTSATRASNLSPISLGTTKKVLGIAAGGPHTCVLFNDGSLKCWGLNGSGQLGLGDILTRGKKASEMGNGLPFVDLGGEKVIDVKASGIRTCALFEDRRLRCWGGYSAIGSGGNVNLGTLKSQMGTNLKPVSLGAGALVEGFSVGNYHTCALLKDNRVKCFGQDFSGSLGQGNPTTTVIGDSVEEMGDNLPPVNISDGLRIIQITAGYLGSCALLENHATKCWGSNNYGTLGVGDTRNRGMARDEMGDNLPFVDLGRFARVESILRSGYHTCARLSNDEIKCWGWGYYGQTGTGVIGDSTNIGTTPGSMGDNLKPVVYP